jgi:hypothetical protein
MGRKLDAFCDNIIPAAEIAGGLTTEPISATVLKTLSIVLKEYQKTSTFKASISLI